MSSRVEREAKRAARKEVREARKAANREKLFGKPDSPVGKALRAVLEEVGLEWDDVDWTFDRPEGLRVVTMPDLVAYCDTLTVEQFEAICRIPASLASDGADTDLLKALEPAAKAAASMGFGSIERTYGLPKFPVTNTPIEAIRGPEAFPSTQNPTKKFRLTQQPQKVALVHDVSNQSPSLPAPRKCPKCGMLLSTSKVRCPACGAGLRDR